MDSVSSLFIAKYLVREFDVFPDGNTDEELCNRWMQLSAFAPFYRNHNELSALSQEPYRWDSVANASRTAIAIRYSLLPYWVRYSSFFLFRAGLIFVLSHQYTLFANASMFGSPTVRALFWEFPDEPELFAVDRQFMVGPDILVTPVLTPNVSTVDGENHRQRLRICSRIELVS